MRKCRKCPLVIIGKGAPIRLAVSLTPADEVNALRSHVQELEDDLKQLRTRYDRLEYNYRCEAVVNLRLVDHCREHGIPVRSDMIWREDWDS